MDFLESFIERSLLILTPDLTVRMAIARLYEGQHRCGVVVAGEKVVGLVTERDLLGCVLSNEDCNQAQITQVMTAPVMTVAEGIDLSAIAALFQQHPIAYLPIVNAQGRPTGLIERREFLQRWETFSLDRQWQTRYELAEVASGQVLYEYDFAQDKILWGANASRILGYGPEELPRRLADWKALIHPEDLEDFNKKTQLASVQGQNFCFQYRWRHKNGLYLWLEDSNEIQEDGQKGFRGVVEMIADITERKREEELRRQQESQIQMMVSAQPAMLYTLVLPPGGKYYFSYVGDQAEAIHEVTVAEILANAESVLGQIHPDDRAMYEAKVAESMACESMFCHDFRIVTPSGQVKWLRANSMPQRQLDGAIAWHGVAIDITSYKHTEQNLVEREAQLQEAQRIAQLGSWELDHKTKKLQWSAELYRIFELDPATTDPDYDLFFNRLPPDEAARVEQAFQTHLHNRQPFELLHRLTFADGRVKYIRQQGATEWNAQGEPIISRGTAQDVTSAYEAQMMLEKLVEGTAAVTGENFFLELVHSLADALGVDYAIASERQGVNLRTLGYYVKGQLVPNMIYSQAQTPCEKTLEQGEYICDSGVQEKFPHDADLSSIKAESYLGMVLRDENQQIIGHLCILDTKPLPLERSQAAMNMVRIFAARASAELQRIRAQRQLEALNRELEIRIAERTQTLEEVSQVQEAILNSTNYIVISTDQNGVIKTFNAEAEKVFGYKAEEVIDCHKPFDFHDPEEMAQRAAELSQQLGRKIEPGMEVFLQDLSQPILHRGEWTIIPKTGDRRIVSLTLTPLKNAQQEIMGVLGVAKDITIEKQAQQEREQIEQALAQSEVRLRCIFDSNVVGIMVCDFQGHIFQANDCFLEMLGYSREDLVSGALNWRTLTPPEYLPLDEAAIARLKVESSLPPWEKAYLHRDGHIVHVLLGVAILEETEESVCVVLDITQRKRAEQALQSQAMQEAMMRQMTQRIRQTLDLQNIFETAATEIRQFLEVDRVGIFRFDPDSGYDDGEFVAESLAPGFDSVLAIHIHDHCFGDGYSHLYLQGQYQATIDVLDSDLQPCHVEILQRFQIRANLVMPLICGDRLWGLLCMHTCTAPRSWQEKEITLVQQISVQLGIAIQQAAFYGQM
ncbi:PAS domain S-box protein, partial [Synechocystis salina LEGE 06155]|nr:PAS domain S-box protein [Synechocystis salina LEGE 06155]